jgi:uncharacterized SAM-binding protein YcdF (DUF218 family)
MRRGVRRVLWIGLAGAVLVAVAYVFRQPILTQIGLSLINDESPRPSDAIVILSGGAPLREIEAAELYARGLAPKVVMTVSPDQQGDALLRRRGVPVESQLEFRKRVLTSLGVQESALLVLSRAPASSTQHEAEMVREWATSNHVSRIIVVTSRMHTARAAWTFSRALASERVEVLTRAPDEDSFRADSWWRDRHTMREAIFEWQKLIFYHVAYR